MRLRNAVAAAAVAVLPVAVLPVAVLPVVAAPVALAVLAVPALGALAGAATPPCGPGCIAPFTQEFGPRFVLDVFRARARVGQPIILFPASTHDGAQDFSYSFQGTVDDLDRASLVSPAMALHYAGLPAFELEYTPYGRGSNLCVGVATIARAGTRVSLQPCGASARTVWILDSFDVPAVAGLAGPPIGYVPLINGSDTNFSHPYVATYPAGGAAPQDRPRPRVITGNLTKFSDGAAFDNQMWGIPEFGPPLSPVPSAAANPASRSRPAAVPSVSAPNR